MISHLKCFLCGREYRWDEPIGLCECGKPLRVEYELGNGFDRAALADRPPNMWRYREVLPPCEPITLGEGMTPLIHAPSMGRSWYVKDESLNPTASFKARGMSAAVSMARSFGKSRVGVPTAGNAGGAMAAYAAAAGMEALVLMPLDTPEAFKTECAYLGARIEEVAGLITDCAARLREMIADEGAAGREPWLDLSTLKEPYRIEGKKTMGYELAEQMEWRLPDVIIYPTGGGTGLIGMWKAFDEMESLGWIGPERPKMVSVQAEGCAPIARAFDAGERFAEAFENAQTLASGLRVPKAIGDFIMLDLIRKSGGAAVTVSDSDMVAGVELLARQTGVFAAPEGGASVAAALALRDRGWLSDDETVVLFNTGSGLKYLEVLASRGNRQAGSDVRNS